MEELLQYRYNKDCIYSITDHYYNTDTIKIAYTVLRIILRHKKFINTVKGVCIANAIPIQAWTGPLWFQEVEASRFPDGKRRW